jgi:hypothetical protein
VTTTIHLTDQELADLQELTKQTDPAEAVRTAMHDYIRYAQRMRLKELSGTTWVQGNSDSLEAEQGESQRRADALGTD